MKPFMKYYMKAFMNKKKERELRSSQNSCRRTSVTVMIRESVEEN